MVRQRWQILVLWALALVGPAAMAEESPVTSLKVGAAQQLGDGGKADWASSDQTIVKVYSDGIAIALAPGEAIIRGGHPIKDFHITVDAQDAKLFDPSTLEQYPDNRTFKTADGRKCVGTVLNGFMLGNGDQTFDEKKDHNRVVDPHPISAGNPYYWQVLPHTPVVDGTGASLGEISAHINTDRGNVPATKINYGMTKVIKGVFCVYAFSTRVNPSKTVAELAGDADQEGTSAWIPLDSVVKKEELLEKVGVGKGKLPAVPLEEQKYRVTGGDAKQYMLPSGHEVSITKNIKIGAVPSHYLRRPSGTVNVCFCVPGFSLGGQSLDSLLVTSGAIFRKAQGVRDFVMPTYYPRGDPKEGQITDKTETFWYGAVEVPNSETVYGWVAKEALAKD